MSIELGRDIHAMSSRQSGQDASGGGRRQQHQQKLRALIAALKAGDVLTARDCCASLVEFNPALGRSYFQRVGHALASGNVSGAQRVIEEIYGQSQVIFDKPVPPMPDNSPRLSMRDDFGVLVDTLA